jgi:hypothetical protein
MKKRISRLEFRFITPSIVRENNVKIYKRLKSTDPKKAEKFKEKFLS